MMDHDARNQMFSDTPDRAESMSSFGMPGRANDTTVDVEEEFNGFPDADLPPVRPGRDSTML